VTTILDCLDDDAIFGPHFKGASWAPWRVFLAALFALGCDDPSGSYLAATGRQNWPVAPFDEAALIVGRRGGKSRTLALIAVFLACFRDYAPFLAPGEVATVAILAANRPQARTIFRYIAGLLKAVPLLAPMIEEANAEKISLNNRVEIEISTASFRTTRGYSFAAILADEVAYWRSEESSANPDVEILRALRPGMATIPGSILLLASSPYGKKGELYNAYRRHHGKDGARVLVWKADTKSMNPKIKQEIIDEAYASDPEAARAEYGGEFRDDLADFVTREIVDAVTCWGRSELPPEPEVTYSAFCDPSGGVSDSMTLAIGHLRDAAVCVLDALLEIRPPFNPDAAVAECAATLRRYGVSRILGDRYAGEWPKVRFAEHGITFEQSAQPKSDIYHDLLPLLNSKRVELLEHTRMSAQLVNLERRTSRGGRDSIDHSAGGHDDCINAAAGVLVMLDLDRRASIVNQSDVLHDGAGLPLPTKNVECCIAVIAADARGQVAVIYAARMNPKPAHLLIMDFDAGPVRQGLFQAIADRLDALAATCHAHIALVYAPPNLLRNARPTATGGIDVQEIPQLLIEDEPLIAAASHFVEGRVKICTPVVEKSLTEAFMGSINFRSIEKSDDAIRRAAVWLASMALDIEA